jgi:hypothetical protein
VSRIREAIIILEKRERKKYVFLIANVKKWKEERKKEQFQLEKLR